jgi:predicted DNA-binding transcriptional regulator AlpA
MIDRMLTVHEMAERSGFSKSYFYTNRSLAKHGHKAASIPPMTGIGRSIRCRESLFEKWLNGDLGGIGGGEECMALSQSST